MALLHHRRRQLPGSEVRRRRGEGDRVLPRSRLHQGGRRRAGAEGAGRFVRQEDALARAAHSDHRRRALQGRHVRLRRQHRGEVAGATADVQAGARRVLQRETDPQGPRQSARGVRRGRLLRIHRLPRLQVPGRAGEPGAGSARGAEAGRALTEDRRGSRRRDDARSRKGSSISSTASRSSATRRRATTSSAASCAWSRTASSTPRRSRTASSGSTSWATSSRSKAARTSTSRRRRARRTRSTSS